MRTRLPPDLPTHSPKGDRVRLIFETPEEKAAPAVLSPLSPPVEEKVPGSVPVAEAPKAVVASDEDPDFARVREIVKDPEPVEFLKRYGAELKKGFETFKIDERGKATI